MMSTLILECICPKGQDGSPCSHHACVVLAYGEKSCNFVATIAATARFKIARLGLGDGAVKDQAFYASIHQKTLHQQYQHESTVESTHEESHPQLDGTEWDLIRAGAIESETETDKKSPEDNLGDQDGKYLDLCERIDEMATALKDMVNCRDEQFTGGVSKLLTRFDKLSTPQSRPKLASAFHQFGWELSSTTASRAGQLRHGKQIAVQATAADRRRKGVTRGKHKQICGPPVKGLAENTAPGSGTGRQFLSSTRYLMPVRNRPRVEGYTHWRLTYCLDSRMLESGELSRNIHEYLLTSYAYLLYIYMLFV